MIPGPKLLFLMNCQACDDVVKLIEKTRNCECGHSSGQLTHPTYFVTGAARVLAIRWEDYDAAIEGEPRPFTVLPRVQPKGRPL